MKKLIFTLAFISLSASAQSPIRLDGMFTYEGIDHVQTKDVEVVPEQRPHRVAELLADKFTCEYIANFYRCVKFSKDTTIPAQILSDIRSKHQFERFKFKATEADVILTNESPSLMEWDIPDSVRSNREEQNKYQYYLLESGIHKIKVPFINEEWFLVHNEKKISLHYMKTKQLDRWKMKEYLILVNFSK